MTVIQKKVYHKLKKMKRGGNLFLKMSLRVTTGRRVGHKGERFVSRYIANEIYCIIWKYRDIAIFRKYRDILTIFSVHDIGQF